MKGMVQESSVIKESIREQEERRQKMKMDIQNKMSQDEQLYKEKKREIEENIAKRPLLVEQRTIINKNYIY